MENHPMNPENFANSVQTVSQVMKEMDQKSQEYFLRFVNASSTMESDDARMRMEVYMSKASVAKKYQSQIRQLPDRRYQIRVHGENIMRTTIEAVIDRIIVVEKRFADSQNETGDPNHQIKKVRTFAELAPHWLAFLRTEVSDGTYRKSVRVIEQLLYGSPLAKQSIYKYSIIDCSLFFKHVKKLKPNISKKDWNGNVMASLRSMMEFAKNATLPVTNHFASFDVHADQFVARKKTPKESRYFHANEVELLRNLIIAETKKKRCAIPLGIVLVYYIGIRDGELCELRWSDLEIKNGVTMLHVQRSQVEETNDEGKHVGYKVVDHCKTDAGNRTIPLSNDALNLLNLVKQLNTIQGIDCSEDALIFQRIKKGKHLPCNIRSFDSRIARYGREMGIERKSMHDMRRSFATLLFRAAMENGQDCERVIDQLRCIMGHSSSSQTKDYIIDLDKNTDSMSLVNLLCVKNASQSLTA